METIHHPYLAKAATLLPNHLGLDPDNKFYIAMPLDPADASQLENRKHADTSIQAKPKMVSVGTQTDESFFPVILQANSSRFNGQSPADTDKKTTRTYISTILYSGFKLGNKILRNASIELLTTALIGALSSIHLYYISQATTD